MRIVVGVLSLVLWSSLATAKPLPKGMKVTIKDQKLYVTASGVTVLMQDAEAAAARTYDALQSAELSDAGDSIIVKAQGCAGSDDDGTEISLAAVEARIENALGMQLHTRKKFTEAIPHFAAAVTKDPDGPVYGTNLLSAQAMAKQLDDADKILAAHGPRHRAWYAWRLAVDPELASLRGRPSAKALVAAKPSTLTWKRLGGSVAVSPLGLAAMSEWSFFGGPGAPGGSELVIYEPVQNKVMLRLPVVALEDACGDGPPEMVTPCTKQMLAHTAEHTRAASLVLAALGFETRPGVALESTDGEAYASKDGKVTAKVSADKITVGGKTAAMLPDEGGHLLSATLAGNLFVLTYRQNGYIACDGDAQRSYSVFHLLK
jgi:hypothetical protein